MTITLSPETEAKLCKQAQWNGEDVNALAESYLLAALEWEERDLQESLAETTRSLESCEAGRTKHVSEVLARLDAILEKSKALK